MTIFRLGYVAMSVNLTNASPSQTMTYTRFKALSDREAAIRKLERIASSNLENCLRLLKHNKAHDIHFFRLSSKLVPLATHDDLKGWNYIEEIKEDLEQIGHYIEVHKMRVGFHPDHFVVINTTDTETFKASIKVLKYHYRLLRAMNIDPVHRCVLHLGGEYGDKEQALEQFITNWGLVPQGIQKMVILENDDKIFNVDDALYICEKLSIPLVFDLHHHVANNNGTDWINNWERIVHTWDQSPVPMKMHISSPKNEKEFRSHADFIDSEMFLDFADKINGSVNTIDCMIEAKQKDQALFKLVDDIKKRPDVSMVDGSTFHFIND